MRRSAEHSIFALFVMAAASACAADDDPTYDPRAGDPEFDAPPALLGQWQERDAEGAVLAEQDYSTRGVVHIVNHSGGVGDAMWWYTVEGSTLTLDFRAGGQPTTHTFPYVVDGDFFMQRAFLPDGPVDGPIGSWRSSRRDAWGPFGDASGGGRASEEVLTVNADGSAVYLATSDDSGSYFFDGNWSIDGTFFTIERERPLGLPNETLQLRYAPGDVFGHELFERVAP